MKVIWVLSAEGVMDSGCSGLLAMNRPRSTVSAPTPEANKLSGMILRPAGNVRVTVWPSVGAVGVTAGSRAMVARVCTLNGVARSKKELRIGGPPAGGPHGGAERVAVGIEGGVVGAF